MSIKTKVLMAGCGNMGGALLQRWLMQEDFDFSVVEPSDRHFPEAVSVERDVRAFAGKHFDIIIVAVKPQMISDVLPDYVELLASGGCFLSMAAGFSIASLEKVTGQNAVVRIMPNMPVMVGKGATALYANEQTTGVQRELISRMMQTTGNLVWVEDEDTIDRFTAVAGSGPGYAFEIARCWVAAAQGLGFTEKEARDMVLQTLAGSAEMALNSESTLDELRNSVTSKNGTTAAGLGALNGDSGLDRLFGATVEAAYRRAIELR